jgi:hypothetical protein
LQLQKAGSEVAGGELLLTEETTQTRREIDKKIFSVQTCGKAQGGTCVFLGMLAKSVADRQAHGSTWLPQMMDLDHNRLT